MKIDGIIRIIKRHSFGCFDVADVDGNEFRIQSAWQIEEVWQSFENSKHQR
jgi:hypothetical protein